MNIYQKLFLIGNIFIWNWWSQLLRVKNLYTKMWRAFKIYRKWQQQQKIGEKNHTYAIIFCNLTFIIHILVVRNTKTNIEEEQTNIVSVLLFPSWWREKNYSNHQTNNIINYYQYHISIGLNLEGNRFFDYLFDWRDTFHSHSTRAIDGLTIFSNIYFRLNRMS